jgi:uncharacterized protein (DUF486 family)
MINWRLLATGGLLIGSNTFMTFAWYYHVKRKAWPLLLAILISWLIALPEYCLQVPANRAGHVDFGGPLRLPQLKIMQEAITLAVFVPFAILYMKQPVKLDYLWASLCIMGAVYFVFRG